jgi:uncharacterized membrane protein
MDLFSEDLLHLTTRGIEWAGILVIVAGLVLGTVRFLWRLRSSKAHNFRNYRADVGRGILLGLEFLVAADIIATIAIEPTLESLAVLAGIIVIRTFLSLSLEVEITGRWPWDQGNEEVEERRDARQGGENTVR